MAAVILFSLAATIAVGPGCAVFHSSTSSTPTPGGQPSAWPSAEGGRTSGSRPGCDPDREPVLPGGDFVVAVLDSVLPDHAPVPHNPAERVVFTQLYETLVRVSCAGDLLPGLASAWTCTDDSSTWVFSLREGARFWDGTPVNAPTVLQAWRRTQEHCPQTSSRDPWSWLDAHAGTIKALDGRRLSISLPEPQAAFPLLLAHPATAVAVRRPGWLWPVGSGPGRLGAGTPPPLPDLVCRPNSHHPRAPRWRSLTFRCLPGTDPRDLVNQDCDLLPASTLQDSLFFAGIPDYRVSSLPLNRTYLLLCPPALNPAGTGAWDTGSQDPARGMTTVPWYRWDRLVIPAPSATACPQLLGPVTSRSSAPLAWHLSELRLDSRTLVYPVGDPAARQLAESIAARLAHPVRLVPLAPGPLQFVLQWQITGAGIWAVDQDYPTGCLQLAALIGSIGWLQVLLPGSPPTGGDSLASALQGEAPPLDPVPSLLASGNIRCLGATHGWLVMKRDLGGIRLGYDGVPWLAGLGRREETDHPGDSLP